MMSNDAALGRPLVAPVSRDSGLEGRIAFGGMMREIDQGQLLASIAATSHDCILSLDAAGAILWASPATERVLGWRPEDLASSDLGVLFPRGSDELYTAALERLVAGERVEPFVDSGVRRDGSTIKAEVTLGPVHGAGDQVTGVIAILRDVTAQLVEQRELALALEMSRAHFDQAVTPQAILDLEGRLESVNPAWCELFGHGEGWFADCDLLDLVHPDDADDVVARLGQLRAGEIDSISYRGLFRDAQGGELPLLLDAALLREPSGRPYAIAASVGDLDDEPLEMADVHAHLPEVLARRTWDNAIVLDHGLTLTYVAGSVARMLGYEKRDPLRHVAWEYVHPSDSPVVAGILERLLTDPRSHERSVLRVHDGAEQWRWVEVTATNCLWDPEIRGIVANLRDVTEQVRTEEALRLSEALHRAMVESAQEGILATSPDERVIFANETAAEIVGRSVAELDGADPVRLLGLPEHDGSDDLQAHEVVHVRPDGGERILRVSRRPLNSRNSGLGSLVSITDVTEARMTERALRLRALHDPLTELPNRYLFLDRLETADARQRRFDGHGTAVLFLDLDGFKQVNDRFGHPTGDGVLREVAARLLASVRATDTVGRLGGDEFAVICEDTGADEALVAARRILAAFEKPVRVDGHDHPVGISIGIALAPPHPFDELIRRADAAMYDAKQRGGAQIALAGHGEDGVAETSPTS
jgi:diguanylate cyclase (GGDEF)-like protein/PAS domain S-box-containing protein